MAEFVVDEKNLTISAVMTAPEFAIVAGVIAVAGTDPLVSLFASFMQQHGAEQRQRDQETIRKFADIATDHQRSEILAVINRKG